MNVNNFSKNIWFMGLVIRYGNVFHLRNILYLPWYGDALALNKLWWYTKNSMKIQWGFPA